MATIPRPALDTTSQRLLEHLQLDARTSTADLTRAVHPTATTGPSTPCWRPPRRSSRRTHVTGEDCFVLEVHARSMRDLERVASRLATLGPITTSVVCSSPLPRRALTPG